MSAHDARAIAAVAVLALSHLLPPALTFINFVPRSWFLSAAGGVSLAYVFVHLLPEVAEAQAAVEDSATGAFADVERHAWLVALAGLLVFYGLERAAVRSRQQAGTGDGSATTSARVFWLSVGSFAIYNAVVGSLLVRRAQEDTTPELALFAAALALHFVINDLGLRHHHRGRYDRAGRPLLVAALVVGAVVGFRFVLADAVVGLLVAFLAGGVVLNVLKEEVPEERQSRFLPMIAGATGYAVVLLAA